MAAFHEYTNKCPDCGDDKLMRIRRKWWMKYLKLSKLYYCPTCHKKFLVWQGKVFKTWQVGHNQRSE